jgi:hypothetical protein
MLRQQAEERSSGAMMFKSGRAVVKRGYVWSEIGMIATIYNLRANNDIARLRPPPAVSEGGGPTLRAPPVLDAPAGAGRKTNAATSPAADATAVAENSQTQLIANS